MMATKMEDTIGKERGYDECADVRAPEKAQPDRKLLALVEVAEVQHDIRYKPSLDETEKGPRQIEGCVSGQTGLAARDNAPRDHLDRNPDIWPQFLRDHLAWEFRA
jgi:hypothetical protein